MTGCIIPTMKYDQAISAIESGCVQRPVSDSACGSWAKLAVSFMPSAYTAEAMFMHVDTGDRRQQMQAQVGESVHAASTSWTAVSMRVLQIVMPVRDNRHGGRSISGCDLHSGLWNLRGADRWQSEHST